MFGYNLIIIDFVGRMTNLDLLILQFLAIAGVSLHTVPRMYVGHCLKSFCVEPFFLVHNTRAYCHCSCDLFVVCNGRRDILWHCSSQFILRIFMLARLGSLGSSNPAILQYLYMCIVLMVGWDFKVFAQNPHHSSQLWFLASQCENIPVKSRTRPVNIDDIHLRAFSHCF